jgi:alkanesulfonate monooxygenase SsuD/methylene tetrahydromethanopterin reductase-like flavin-dependent oxidoreductase (luciferase family)
MITKFTTVYAGHVDLPDRAQNATPANERRYSNKHLASVFDKTEALAKKMDALSSDTLWLAEHHFQHEGYECIPNDLMLALVRERYLVEGLEDDLDLLLERSRLASWFNIGAPKVSTSRVW